MPRKIDYTKYSNEELIAEITELKKRKKYGLVWDEEREPEKVVTQCKNELPVLKEVKSKAIQNDPDKPTHILIEGDNYHALSVLNYTHQNAIDVIYIDPPYNTGAKDWKYNNHFVDDNDVYRHSKWLSFIGNRLNQTKNLLSENGVLICTIDHNELNTLGLLLKEIFHNKEITCVTIIHNPSGIQGKNFSHNNEYAYFVHSSTEKEIAPEIRDEKDADVRQFMNTAKGSGKNYLRESGRNCFYPILVKDKKIIGFGDICDDSYHPESPNIQISNGITEVYPIDTNKVERKWVFERKTVENINDELSIKLNDRTNLLEVIRTKNKINYKTVWVNEKFSAKTYGTQLLKQIIDIDFPFPKSLYAVMECITAVVHDKNNSIILDYFAGSGTTGHAVLELNKKDNGNRQFILSTNNENNIINEVCFPRIQRVIEGYEFEGNEKELIFEHKFNLMKLRKADEIYADYLEARENNEDTYDELKGEFKENTLKLFGIKKYDSFKDGLGGNLKYFKTTFVPAKSTDRNKEKLTKQSVEMLCLKENTFDSVLDLDNIKIFKNNDHYTGILFDEKEIPNFKEQIKNYDLPVSVYVFSLGDDDFAEEFSDIKDKVKVCSIPSAILRVYKRIFR